MKKNLKILILEDEQAIRNSLKDFFEDQGFIVIPANNGEEALNILKYKEINVVIVDMRLPGMDGETFIQKAFKIQKNIYFIIHTGSVQFKRTKELQKLGINEKDILLKPVKDLNIFLELFEDKFS